MSDFHSLFFRLQRDSVQNLFGRRRFNNVMKHTLYVSLSEPEFQKIDEIGYYSLTKVHKETVELISEEKNVKYRRKLRCTTTSEFILIESRKETVIPGDEKDMQQETSLLHSFEDSPAWVYLDSEILRVAWFDSGRVCRSNNLPCFQSFLIPSLDFVEEEFRFSQDHILYCQNIPLRYIKVLVGDREETYYSSDAGFQQLSKYTENSRPYVVEHAVCVFGSFLRSLVHRNRVKRKLK